MGHSMDKIEIRQIVHEEVETAASQRFGVIQEWMADQFQLIRENFQMVHEKMDRNFAEMREDLEQIKRNTDRNSLDIVGLQQKDKESWRRYKKY